MPETHASESEQSLPARSEIVGQVEGSTLHIYGGCADCRDPILLYSLPLSNVLGSNPVFTEWQIIPH